MTMLCGEATMSRVIRRADGKLVLVRSRLETIIKALLAALAAAVAAAIVHHH